MAGFLSKLFKPKWQNASAAIRLQAIQELDATNSENQTILLQLLDDQNENVRLAAIEKVQSTEALLKKFNDATEADKQALMARINQLASNLGLSLFDLIEDKTLLAEMIVSSNDAQSFLSGLARLEDESALLTIASKAQSRLVRQAASELIESEEQLHALAAIAKSRDKRVYQVVKTKLAAIRERHKQSAQTENELNELLESLKAHAATEATQQYDAKLKSLQQRWEALLPQAPNDISTQITEQLTTCAKRAQAMQQAKAEIESVQAAQHSNEEQHATLKLLVETRDRLESQPCEARELPALDGLIKTQETRWIESARDAEIGKQDQKRYQQAMQSLRAYLKSMNLLAAKKEDLELLLSNVEKSIDQTKSSLALKQLQSELEWPESYEKPALMKRLSAALGEQHERQRKQEKESLVSNFHNLISRLDQELEEKQYSKSKALLKDARKTLSQLEPQSRHALQSAINLRSAQLNELKDWQGYASAKRQHELCEAMEKLVDLHVPPEDKAQKIKALQSEWKALGGSENESLWQQFSKAADAAFEPCAEYFKEQNALREQNLQRRKTLLEELTAFVDGNDWSNPDWKATETINRRARSEWREAYPVDPRKGKSIQKKFNAVLDRLDGYLRTEKDKNLALKRGIVEQAQALLEDTPLNEAMNRAKALQSEWQQAGIADHKKERALWKKFRVACDAIFAQRDAERDENKKAQQEKLNEASALCNDMTDVAAQTTTTLAELETARKAFRQRAKAFNDLSGKHRSTFQDQFSSAMHQLDDAVKQLQSTEVLGVWQEARRKSEVLSATALSGNKDASLSQFNSQTTLPTTLENSFKAAWESIGANQFKAKTDEQVRELCIRCEIAAGLNSPETDQEMRMQLQVSRLSEGLSRSRSESREEQIKPLLSSWYSDPEISPELRKKYEGRVWASVESLYLPTQTRKKKELKELEGA